MDYVGIGKRIRAQRYKLDLSQEELAEMAGIFPFCTKRILTVPPIQSSASPSLWILPVHWASGRMI